MLPHKKRRAPRNDLGVRVNAAARFLRRLDPDAEAFTFQTWADGKDDRRLVRLLHGSLDEHADELADLNRRGAAVAVTMNETDLKGTKRENVVCVRAVVLDLDNRSTRQQSIRSRNAS